MLQIDFEVHIFVFLFLCFRTNPNHITELDFLMNYARLTVHIFFELPSCGAWLLCSSIVFD